MYSFACYCTDADDAGIDSQSVPLTDWLQAKLNSVIGRLRGNTPDHHGDPESVAGGSEEAGGDSSVPKSGELGETGSEQVPGGHAATKDVRKSVRF